MSPAERDDRRLTSEEPDPVLEDAVRALRAEVPVRAEWRRELLAKLEAAAPDATAVRDVPVRELHGRRWSARPSVAIAAAVGFVLLGVGLANVVRPRAASVPQVAAGSVATPAAVRFVLVSEDAQRVSLVGDFNGWNAATLPLQRGPDGRSWTIEVRLPPGRYAYAFSVDGRLVADPSAPRSADEDFGVPTSVALVAEQRS